ncbi:MAG: hypothetical protein RXQ79_07165 [Acidilobus sp.]
MADKKGSQESSRDAHTSKKVSRSTAGHDAYVSKVSKSIAGIVGDDAARILAEEGYAKMLRWAELISAVTEGVYKDVVRILIGDVPNPRRYLRLVRSLVIDFWNSYKHHDNGMPEDHMKALARLWELDPKKRIEYDKALQVIKIINKKFLELDRG